MTLLKVPLEITKRISFIAQETGKESNFIVTEALISYIEDFKDICEAKQRILDIHTGKSQFISHEEMVKRLDLEN